MPAIQPPEGLRAWGQQLWDTVTEHTSFDPAGYYILAEACRTADIIERLSGALRAGSSQWVSLADEIVEAVQISGVDVAEINLVVNPILGEIRQQRLALRQLLAQLKLGKTEAETVEDDPIAKLMAEFSTPD
ncbi:terminase small subunit [Mycobacterium phage Reindeer]|uniref:Terminase small subunit n=1 Tax=Mycobacterium phage Reindeer TaxID=2762283 RepID=A0A7G8LHU9_9CAUD|nr:terminase small subunit [Mycobacterium phage Reindeer]QNJ56821.1 terminase small subunit [Mycobacterium phage Reindeer]